MPKLRYGSGGVYRRGRIWWITYNVASKQRRESAKTTDKSEASRLLRQRLGEIAEGRYVETGKGRLSFEDLANMVVADYEVKGLATLRELRIRVDKHLRPFFAGKLAQDISATDVRVFIAKRQAAGAANASINRETSALKRSFNLAIQAERLYKKPYMPRLPEKNVREGFVERWEYEAVLSKVPEYLRPPMMFAYWTGWRLNKEVLALEWSNVDLDEGTVRLRFGSTKNGDGRVIFLPEDLYAMLAHQQAEQRRDFPACSRVFHRDGHPIKSIRGSWERACAETGLTGKIPHDFRRTAVRNLVRAGVSEHVAQTMTGHKTRDVFDRYDIVSEGDLREAAVRLNRRISLKPSQNQSQ